MRAAELTLDTIRVEQDGRVLTAWIEDPPYNFMTLRMQADLDTLSRAVEDDASVGAVIITSGIDGRYITHFDIGEILTAAERAGTSLPSGALRTLLRGIELAGRVPGIEELVEATHPGARRVCPPLRGWLIPPDGKPVGAPAWSCCRRETRSLRDSREAAQYLRCSRKSGHQRPRGSPIMSP